jgi:hypothetical protein
MAGYTRIRSFLSDQPSHTVDLRRIPAALIAQAEVLLGAEPSDGVDAAVRELAAASSRAFTALLAAPADAEQLELVAYDDTGSGEHTYVPAGHHWLNEAAELAFSAAVRLSDASDERRHLLRRSLLCSNGEIR